MGKGTIQASGSRGTCMMWFNYTKHKFSVALESVCLCYLWWSSSGLVQSPCVVWNPHGKVCKRNDSGG